MMIDRQRSMSFCTSVRVPVYPIRHCCGLYTYNGALEQFLNTFDSTLNETQNLHFQEIKKIDVPDLKPVS